MVREEESLSNTALNRAMLGCNLNERKTESHSQEITKNGGDLHASQSLLTQHRSMANILDLNEIQISDHTNLMVQSLQNGIPCSVPCSK